MSLTIEELSKKTVLELRSYAKKNKIELFESKTKLEILEILASWIPPKVEGKVKENLEEKVAIYSERNISMENLKSISVGYNIVTKEAAERWLTHRMVRMASPEEVASYYGKA